MITKEQAFESLKGKFAKNSPLSEQSIDETLENLMPFVTEETTLGDFLEKAEKILKTTEGNIRKVNSETAKELEKKYKEQKKDEPSKNDSPMEPKEEETPEWAKTLLDWKKKSENVELAEKSKKEALDKVKIYPKSVVDIVSDGFDFTVEGAAEKFTEKVSEAAGKLGITPEKTEAKEDASHLDSFFSRLKEEQNGI